MTTEKNAVLKQECHSPKSLWGIFRVRNARGVKVSKGYEENPRTLRAAISGMTTYLNLSPLTPPSPSWRGNTNNPLPPRGGRFPVGADEGEQPIPTHSVIPLLRTAENAGYSGRAGFTLIELLVVVLIIGILAAVALPQYQNAVLKSRFSSLMLTTKAIADGNEMYYLTQGQYASNVGDLDVKVPNKAEEMSVTVQGSANGDYAYTIATRPDIKNNLIIYQKHSKNYPGETHCEAETDNARAEWLCETAMHGTQITDNTLTNGYTLYVLTGTGSKSTPTVDPICAFYSTQGSTCAAKCGPRGCEKHINEETHLTVIHCTYENDVCVEKIKNEITEQGTEQRGCLSNNTNGICEEWDENAGMGGGVGW